MKLYWFFICVRPKPDKLKEVSKKPTERDYIVCGFRITPNRRYFPDFDV